MNNSIDTSPKVRIFSLSSDHTEGFQNVDYVVNSSSLNPKLFGALIKKQKVFLLFAINAQEPAAKLTQTFFLAIVLGVIGFEKASRNSI
jgi:hypothetical protein